MTRLLSLLLLTACAPRVPVIPGPLAVVREVPRGNPARPRPRPADALMPLSPGTPARPVPSGFGPRMASEASSLVMAGGAEDFRDDCSGFVCAASDQAGLPLRGDTRRLWDLADALDAIHRRKRPHLGDLVFFDQTYDRNSNGRLDDDLTHVGIVVEVVSDGTVVVAHRGSNSRTTLRMNLHDPHAHQAGDGSVLNDYLRRRTSRDRRGTAYLAGELFRAFATVRDDDLALWAEALTR